SGRAVRGDPWSERLRAREERSWPSVCFALHSMSTRRFPLLIVVLSMAFSGPARAELEQLHRVDMRHSRDLEANAMSTGAAVTLSEGRDPATALELAERGIAAAPRDPWVHYQRAQALVALSRIDEAVRSFQDSQVRFPKKDLWGRSVAIWGRAWALAKAHRCEE